MAAVRDFDSTQLQADYDAILAQAGVTFTYFGTTVTGIWSSSRNMFDEFSEQRREEEKFTVFLLPARSSQRRNNHRRALVPASLILSSKCDLIPRERAASSIFAETFKHDLGDARL